MIFVTYFLLLRFLKTIIFFEIELLGIFGITVGWTTRMSDFPHCGLHDNDQTLILEQNYSQPGDVIGCFVDVEAQTAIFYYNGKLTKQIKNESFFEFTPIYAVAQVPHKQKIIANFGQTSFKYLPRKNYKDFFSETKHFELKKGIYSKWFCKNKETGNLEINFYDFPQINQLKMPVCFRDLKQQHFDQIVLTAEKMVNENVDFKIITKYINNEFKKEKSIHIVSRFVQSLIEVAGLQKNKNNSLNIFFYYIFQSFQLKLFNQSNYHAILVHYLDCLQTNDSSISEQFKINNLCNFLVYVKNPFCTLHKYCCSYNANYACDILEDKCISFLCKVFLYSTDNYWNQLCSYIVLKNICNKNNVAYLLKSYNVDLFSKQIQKFVNWNKNFLNETEMKKNMMNKKILFYFNYFCVYVKIFIVLILITKNVFK